FLSGQYSSHCA
ncbi:hypothetical protein D050_3483B, partial [Vibrio parahaemolyticus VPCR-2009]